MPTCIEGHASVAEDYCDVCGSPMGSPAAPSTPAPAAGAKECPACGAPVNGRFCESCGHDSALPEPVPRDPAARPRSRPGRCGPSSSPPTGSSTNASSPAKAPIRSTSRRTSRNVESPCRANTAMIGRGNRDQGVQPEIDLGIHPADRGVSSQHAVLRIHDSGLTITDIGSTNGTTLNGSDDRLGKGEETPLADGDRIHVGAWTTITVVQGR